MNLESEEDLQNLIHGEVRNFLSHQWTDILETGTETKIIKDCTVVPDSGKFNLLLAHARTDIAIYLTSDGLSDELSEGDQFKLRGTGDKDIRVPLVIIEVKRSPHIDAIRSRDVIARDMKEIFPFMAYMFVADDTWRTEEALYRHGKNFDEFFITDDEATTQWITDGVISRGVKPHLENLAALPEFPSPPPMGEERDG